MTHDLDELHPLAERVAKEGVFPDLERRLKALPQGVVGWAVLSLSRIAAGMDQNGRREEALRIVTVLQTVATQLAQETAMFEQQRLHRQEGHFGRLTGNRPAKRAPKPGAPAPANSLKADQLIPPIRKA